MTIKEQRLKAIESIPTVDVKIPLGFPAPLMSQCYLEIVNNNMGETTTESGIIIPSTVNEKTIIPCVGIVVALGPDSPEYLKIGHRVLYPPFIEEKIMFKGKLYLRVNSAHDILGVLPEEAFLHEGVKSDAHVRRDKRRDASERLAKHHEKQG